MEFDVVVCELHVILLQKQHVSQLSN